jgi:hypothetical protein
MEYNKPRKRDVKHYGFLQQYIYHPNIYRIMTLMKVETEIITNIAVSSTLVKANLRYCQTNDEMHILFMNKVP